MMMKKIVYLLIAVLIQIFGFSQNIEITWQQCFGGSEQEIARDIIEISDGYFIVGDTESNDGDVSFNNGIVIGWRFGFF